MSDLIAETLREMAREDREFGARPRLAARRTCSTPAPDRPSDAGGVAERFERLPGGGYRYERPDDAVGVELRFLRRESGHVHAEVDVHCTWAGARHHRGSLSCADLNLSSQSARKALGKYCAERARTGPDDYDWLGVIDAAALLTIRAERDGDDVIVLDDAPDILDRDVDVGGLKVPTDAASILIAHGDSLKSLITLYVLGTFAQRGQRVLYLDWEWTADRHRARKRRLFGDERLDGLHYRRCRAPLVVEADRIRRYCETNQITHIGVDSVGLACDGKLIDDDVAIRFHRALGTLPPALCAAHVPKSSLGPDGKGDAIGPFGSVFFSNLCRASWLVKKQPSATENIVSVGLFPQKQNDGDPRRPAGLEFTFTTDRITVKPVDVANVDGLAERLPLPVRMSHLLKKQGALTYSAIAEKLDAKLDSVIRAVNRGSGFTKVSGKDGVLRIGLVETQRAS